MRWLNKMASISPICKKCKNFISARKSPTYIDFMIKKNITIRDIKISHLGTFKQTEQSSKQRKVPWAQQVNIWISPLLAFLICLFFLFHTDSYIFSTVTGIWCVKHTNSTCTYSLFTCRPAEPHMRRSSQLASRWGAGRLCWPRDGSVKFSWKLQARSALF
jgi:hypothetical protein